VNQVIFPDTGTPLERVVSLKYLVGSQEHTTKMGHGIEDTVLGRTIKLYLGNVLQGDKSKRFFIRLCGS
jgi:hypothetical protein